MALVRISTPNRFVIVPEDRFGSVQYDDTTHQLEINWVTWMGTPETVLIDDVALKGLLVELDDGGHHDGSF